MKHLSSNKRFICDTTNILEDGCGIYLNPAFYGKSSEGKQIGFVTDSGDFYIDTNGDQIEMKPDDIREIIGFIDKIFYEAKI